MQLAPAIGYVRPAERKLGPAAQEMLSCWLTLFTTLRKAKTVRSCKAQLYLCSSFPFVWATKNSICLVVMPAMFCPALFQTLSTCQYLSYKGPRWTFNIQKISFITIQMYSLNVWLKKCAKLSKPFLKSINLQKTILKQFHEFQIDIFKISQSILFSLDISSTRRCPPWDRTLVEDLEDQRACGAHDSKI